MAKENLRNLVQALRTEIEHSGPPSAEVQHRLNGLLTQLEGEVEGAQPAPGREGLLNNVKDSVHQLEAEHPKLTAMLIEIMRTLGGAGI
ncbi:MAG: DUF4404 family protein [Planctomycetota bacterium]